MNHATTKLLAGQVLVAGFPGTEAPEELLRACERGELGGIILFKRNLGQMHEVAALIARFVERAPTECPLLVGVDQEGGRVARLGAPVLKLPPMARLAALGDVQLTERAGALLGKQLGALGFSMNFAPVLDVNTNPQNPVIGDRAFGSGPEQVIEQALAFARGLQGGPTSGQLVSEANLAEGFVPDGFAGRAGRALPEHVAGVLACGKHFPGHGDTDLDSHLALPRLSHARERLERVELAPFRAAQGHIAAVMTAHVVFEQLAPGVPATLARQVVTGLLREELGYDGLIISDDLEMRAIADHYGVEQAACLAIEAGCDTLLVCSRVDWFPRAQAALAEKADGDPAFRRRLEDAAARAIATRARRRPEPVTDPTQLEARLECEAARALGDEIAARIAAA